MRTIRPITPSPPSDRACRTVSEPVNRCDQRVEKLYPLLSLLPEPDVMLTILGAQQPFADYSISQAVGRVYSSGQSKAASGATYAIGSPSLDATDCDPALGRLATRLIPGRARKPRVANPIRAVAMQRTAGAARRLTLVILPRCLRL